MSGGSYEYLYSAAENDTLESHREELERMRARLAELGATRAAWRTGEVIRLLDAAKADARQLEQVWHAVEWWDSCDWGEEQVREVLGNYERPK